MTKKIKFFILLSLILLVLILYLILTSESVKRIGNSGLPNGQAGQPAKNEITALSEENYKIMFKEIFTVYETLAINNNFSLEKIGELKNKLLEIKGIPAGFQKLHLNFILALDRIENYLTHQDAQEKNASQQIINQLKADYSWLNN